MRIPSLSVDEAEALLGPRGMINPDITNRATLRKWCAAKGLPAAVAATLSMSALGKAYNDATDAYLKAVARNHNVEMGGNARYQGQHGAARDDAPQGDMPGGAGPGQGNAQGQQGQGQGEAQGQGQPQQGNGQGGEQGQGQGQGETAQDKAEQDQAAKDAADKAKAEGHSEQWQKAKADEARAAKKAEQQAKRQAQQAQQQAMQQAMGDKGELSPEARKALADAVREEMEKQGTKTIEVKQADKPAVKLDGPQHPVFERVLKLVIAGANVLLVGPAGTGKSYLSEQIGKALGREYGAINGTAGASETQLTGWLLPVGENGRMQYVPSIFVRLYQGGNSVFCFDEMDAFDPNMLLIANGALANGHIFIAHKLCGQHVKRGENTSIIGTANTWGTGANQVYMGRNGLDASTTDRFIKVYVDYDKGLERRIAKSVGLAPEQAQELWSLRDKVMQHKLRRLVSTRAFQQAGMMLSAGDSWSTVMETITAGWTPDELAKIGRRA